MIIDEKLLKHLADLSRLSLKKEEKEIFLKDLEEILAYFEKIKNVQTENVLPFWQKGEQKNVFRSDDFSPLFDFSDCLEQFPEEEKNLLKVPRVLGD